MTTEALAVCYGIFLIVAGVVVILIEKNNPNFDYEPFPITILLVFISTCLILLGIFLIVTALSNPDLLTTNLL